MKLKELLNENTPRINATVAHFQRKVAQLNDKQLDEIYDFFIKTIKRKNRSPQQNP